MINLHAIRAHKEISDQDKSIIYGLGNRKFGIDADGCVAYLSIHYPKWYFFKFENRNFYKVQMDRWIKAGRPEPKIELVSIDPNDPVNRAHDRESFYD